LNKESEFEDDDDEEDDDGNVKWKPLDSLSKAARYRRIEPMLECLNNEAINNGVALKDFLAILTNTSRFMKKRGVRPSSKRSYRHRTEWS